ncbi:transcriptional repressor [Phreatobacter aquaticus]|uniref:Transcriptional repressor n=1 Tax=Phreatobacter aquaticus TaxID=2570229 RepID=A0A4D7QDU0_9HYPH|nr:transcriptional repressor [Phreatobacter aquaticus]QCK84855.1 transcriptional repressor [Phreatobacter aquaticus]
MSKAHHHAHDHEACAHGHPPTDALTFAEARCAERRLKLTPIRREVLEHLAGSPAPVGAYDLIERMERAKGRRPAPITVYRALEFLLEAGLAHRIESRNAYVACAHRHEHSDLVLFMICDACGCVSEAPAAKVQADLDLIAAAANFKPTTKVVEIFGRCAHCA